MEIKPITKNLFNSIIGSELISSSLKLINLNKKNINVEQET